MTNSSIESSLNVSDLRKARTSLCSWTCEPCSRLWFWLAPDARPPSALVNLWRSRSDLCDSAAVSSRGDRNHVTNRSSSEGMEADGRGISLAANVIFVEDIKLHVNSPLLLLFCRHGVFPPAAAQRRHEVCLRSFMLSPNRSKGQSEMFLLLLLLICSFFYSFLIKTSVLFLTSHLLRVFLIWSDLNVNFLFCLCPSWRQREVVGRAMSHAAASLWSLTSKLSYF